MDDFGILYLSEITESDNVPRKYFLKPALFSAAFKKFRIQLYITHLVLPKLFKPQISASMGRMGKYSLRLSLPEISEKFEAGSISVFAGNFSLCIQSRCA